MEFWIVGLDCDFEWRKVLTLGASDVQDCASFVTNCNAVSFQNRTFKSARRWTTSKWLWEDCSWVIDASKFCNQMQCCILKSKTYKSAQDTEQLLRLHPAAGWSMPPQVTDVFTEYSIVIFVIKCNAVMFKAKLKKCETYLAAGWSILPQVTDVGLAAILEHSAAFIWCTKSMHQIFVLFFFLFWPQIKHGGA